MSRSRAFLIVAAMVLAAASAGGLWTLGAFLIRGGAAGLSPRAAVVAKLWAFAASAAVVYGLVGGSRAIRSGTVRQPILWAFLAALSVSLTVDGVGFAWPFSMGIGIRVGDVTPGVNYVGLALLLWALRLDGPWPWRADESATSADRGRAPVRARHAGFLVAALFLIGSCAPLLQSGWPTALAASGMDPRPSDAAIALFWGWMTVATVGVVCGLVGGYRAIRTGIAAQPLLLAFLALYSVGLRVDSARVGWPWEIQIGADVGRFGAKLNLVGALMLLFRPRLPRAGEDPADDLASGNPIDYSTPSALMNGCRGETDVATTVKGLDGLPKRSGKVRDVYDLGDRLLLVASDRISAFDWILPTPIPDKGRVLSGLSEFWFQRLGIPDHLISTNIDDFPVALDDDAREYLRGRAMLVRKARVAPFECVVRGYLSGSGWREYRKTGAVCGVKLPAGLVESDRLPEPIFTPATKAETGHDENVSFDAMADALGADVAGRLRDVSLDAYRKGAELALSKGLILVDTKFEWGFDEQTGELLLIDEVLTPDSSRYWDVETYKPGGAQPSFDKQFVRDWLETTGWDKAGEPPQLPADVVAGTRSRYVDAYERLTDRAFPWL